MMKRKRKFHYYSSSKKQSWPIFIISNGNQNTIKTIILSIIVYLVILFLAYKIQISSVYHIKSSPIEIFYEQSYIETFEDENLRIDKKTKYYGAHNQSASQEKMKNKTGKDPFVEGKTLSQKIINAPINNPLKIYKNQDNQLQSASHSTQESFNDFFKKGPKENIGETITQPDILTKKAPTIGLNRNKQAEKIKQYIDQSSQKKTEQYVRLNSIHSIEAPVRKSETSVSNIGKISMNVARSEFGEYEQRLLEAISYRWTLLSQRLTHSLSTGEIIVEYILNRDGTITDVTSTKCTASRSFALICCDSIASQSPQPEWSEDMIAKFGNSRKMSIKFIYY